MNPLHIRSGFVLHAAPDCMLNDGLDTKSATFEVGYGSASRFSRFHVGEDSYFQFAAARCDEDCLSNIPILLKLVGNKGGSIRIPFVVFGVRFASTRINWLTGWKGK